MKQINIENILQQLPSSWETFTLAQYMLTTDCEISENPEDPLNGIDNTLQIVAKITGYPVEEIEQLSMMDINKIGKRLDFMMTPPRTDKKTSIIWKDISKITYDEYISFVQLSEDHLRNLDKFVSIFSTELTEEQIRDLPIEEVLSGFFLLVRSLKKSVRRLIQQEKRKLKQFQKEVH